MMFYSFIKAISSLVLRQHQRWTETYETYETESKQVAFRGGLVEMLLFIQPVILEQSVSWVTAFCLLFS